MVLVITVASGGPVMMAKRWSDCNSSSVLVVIGCVVGAVVER